MGRRSRRRGETPAPPQARPRERRARLDEAPRSPWHPVPLTELCIFVGMVLLGAALLGAGPQGLLVGVGLVLVVLATGELALREHLAGYRSHSSLLAGLAAIGLAAPLAALLQPPKSVVITVAVVVFLLVLQVAREVFRRRSGGLSWRA